MQSLLLALIAAAISSLSNASIYKYASNEQHPFGQYNPLAPKEVQDFAQLIGRAQCQSTTRIDQENWTTPVDMVWTFKYIMNGMAVQDLTLKSNGTHSGSVRQFNPDTRLWHVHFYTSRTILDELPVWTGGKKGSDLVFWKTQKAPNGVDGYYRLTFYEISEFGYKWKGEWVSEDYTLIYPTWKIECLKG